MSDLQRSRRRDPTTWTWEPFVAAALVALLTLILTMQVGRGIANLLMGAGWTWPTSDPPSFWPSIKGIMNGDAAAGLSPVPSTVAPPWLLWTCVGLCEAVAVFVVIACTVQALRRWGPGRMRGMATLKEVEATLGVSRLRSNAAVIRPDLYGRRPTSPAHVPHHDTDPSIQHEHPGRNPWARLQNRTPS